MVTIRSAKTNETVELQRLNKEVFVDNHRYDQDLDLEWSMSDKGREYFTEVLNDPLRVCFVGEDNGILIGYILLRHKKMEYRKSQCAEICELGVSQNYRSQGIGSQLIQKARFWAKEHGYKKLYVNCYFHNTRAISFYKKNGLSEIDLGLEMNL